MPVTREKDGNAVRYLSAKEMSGWQYDKKRKKWFTWGIDLTLSGVRIREKGFKSKDDAERHAETLKVRDRDERYGLPVKMPPIFLSQVFDALLLQISNIARQKYERVVLDRFIEICGDMIITRLTVAHLYKYSETRGADKTKRGTTISSQTLRRELTIIHSALNRARRIYPALENYHPPTIPRPRYEENRRTGVLTQEEKAKLLEWLMDEIREGETIFYYNERIRIAHALRFAWATGARKKDAALIEWKDFDEAKDVLRLYRYKNNVTSIFSPLPRKIKELLNERRKISGEKFIFTTSGSFSSYFDSIIEAACNAAGITHGRFAPDGFTFHSARHDFISNLLENHVDIETARELAGLSKDEILLLYAHSSAKSRKRAVLLIDDF